MNGNSRIAAVILVLQTIYGMTFAAEGLRELTIQALRDKVEGGWAGQMIGVSYAAKTEFRYKQQIIEGTWEEWKPDMVSRALTQDDIYGDMGFMKTLDDKGLCATTEDFGVALRDSTYHLAHANLAARRALRRGVPATESGLPVHNVHANDIDFQIDADFVGMVSPGMPQFSNDLSYRAGRVVNYGEGVYGGMFIAGCYAAAFFEKDARKVVECGLACLPAQSPYAKLISDVLLWSKQHPDDWRKVWELIQEKWDKDDPCPEGALLPFNIDARINGSYVALGLLYGKDDFGKTIEVATRCGQDSDSNSASAGGIWGVMYGYGNIPDMYKSGIPSIADKTFSQTQYTFRSIVDSTVKHATHAICQNGGKVAGNSLLVKVQSPTPAKLELWDPGKPLARIPESDARWQWKGAWQTRDERGMRIRMTAEKGAEAQITFEGTGAIITGAFFTSGGLFEMYLDGRLDRVLDVFDNETRYRSWIWHKFDLKPGRHTLRLVVRGERYPGSEGADVGICDLIVFGK
ncbi:MAG: ADP-ribosylglycohydrolase family protein [Candidatus Sumerlaeia bacterium]|nr:ADP-ribosylglycohydrolase family protein [Candidatus Sumerlaeia bacterium]